MRRTKGFFIKSIGIIFICSLFSEYSYAGIWQWWTKRFQAELKYLDKIDFWGNATTQLPKGLLGIKYNCNFVKGGVQWDMKGNSMGGVLPVIIGDFGPQGGIKLDPRATGGAAFHSVQISYGISDAVDFYIKIPFMHLKVDLDPVYEVRGLASIIFGQTLEDFYKTIETFGRPRPSYHYETNGVEMSDIDFGFSWQYLRNSFFAGSLTLRVYAPTGRLANPDRQIYLLLGPELDAGKGSWGFGLSAAYDARIPYKRLKYIVFSAEMDVQQRLPYKRTFPHFKKPDYSKVQNFGNDVVAGLKSFFPDVSADAGRKYTIYPGTIFGLMASMHVDVGGVIANLPGALDAGVEYDYIAVMSSIVKGLHPAADAMMSSTLFAGGATEHHLQVGVSTSALMALSIPLRLKFKYEWMFAGTNTLQLVDNWGFGVELYLPIDIGSIEKTLNKSEGSDTK